MLLQATKANWEKDIKIKQTMVNGKFKLKNKIMVTK